MKHTPSGKIYDTVVSKSFKTVIEADEHRKTLELSKDSKNVSYNSASPHYKYWIEKDSSGYFKVYGKIIAF